MAYYSIKRLLPGLSYSLLFLPARIYSADKIKLIAAQRNESMH